MARTLPQDRAVGPSPRLYGTRMAGLRPFVDDQRLAVLRLLVEIGAARSARSTPARSPSCINCCSSMAAGLVPMRDGRYVAGQSLPRSAPEPVREVAHKCPIPPIRSF